MNKYNLSKDYQFDIDVSAYTSYAGKLALPYVTAAVKSPDTIANGYVRVIDGLNKSGRITNVGCTDPVQAAGCTFNDGSNTALTEQVVTLTDMKVNEEICRGTVFPSHDQKVKILSKSYFQRVNLLLLLQLQIKSLQKFVANYHFCPYSRLSK